MGEVGIDLFLLNQGNAYDGLACLFGVRNSYGFRPLAEDRGFPGDASPGLQGECAGFGPHDAHGTTWLTWAELNTTDAVHRRVVAAGGGVLEPPPEARFGSGAAAFVCTVREPEGSLWTFGTYHGPSAGAEPRERPGPGADAGALGCEVGRCGGVSGW
ncbi:hypothetical protein [Streptomyces sp. NPDC017524]|uniref:hypothetical protein n=1 Tax=unclassified Streptomyces TaxID=2593676 RepID=UPI0037BD1FFF